MIKFDNVTGKEIIKHNLNWSEIFYHPHNILLTDQSKSGKTIALLTLISHQPSIHETKSQLLINGIEIVWSKYYNDPKTFIEYSNDTDYV